MVQLGSAWLGYAAPTAQLVSARLSTSYHLGKHRSAELGSTQLGLVWFSLAQPGLVPVQAELPGRRWHCIQGGLAGGRLPKPEPVPPAPLGQGEHGAWPLSGPPLGQVSLHSTVPSDPAGGTL